MRLEEHLRSLPEAPDGPGRWTAVVVGAGFTGLEIATELVGRLRAKAAPYGAADEVRVVLVERAQVIGEGLGAAARPVITEALDELDIERRPAPPSPAWTSTRCASPTAAPCPPVRPCGPRGCGRAR